MSRYLLYRAIATSTRNMILNVFKFHLIPSSGTVRRSNRPLFTTGGDAILLLTCHFIHRVHDVAFRRPRGDVFAHVSGQRRAQLSEFVGFQHVQE